VTEGTAPTRKTDLQKLNISALRFRCAEESDRFFRRQSYDPRFCYEIFRRAVLDRDEHAWEQLYIQYRPLVTGWVERHSLFPGFHEEAQYFVNRAFEKMWTAISPEKFENFPDLKSILRYLQMCVHSVLVDTARSAERSQLFEEESEERSELYQADDLDPEATVVELAENQELWQWLNTRLKDERERCVLYGSFVLDMKPAEVFQAYKGMFKHVREVYAVKDNLLARLRRDDELQQRLLGL
jgi:RNA polymerase sigma factor (sigma-70 family)